MVTSELLKPVLLLVISFVLRLALTYTNKGIEAVNKFFGVQLGTVKVDDTVFNALVLGIVVWLLSQLGIDAAVRAGFI